MRSVKFTLWNLIFFWLLLLGADALGQCGPCTITFNNATGNPIPNRNIQDDDIVCISANRTTQINLRNADDLVVCIASGVTYSNTFSGLSGDDVVINNYGQIGTSGTPRNLILDNDGIFNNFGIYFGNFTSNGGSDINNSGSITGNVTLNSNGAVYTNSGTQSGNLALNNNSLVNSGTLALNQFSIGGSSPGITNETTGVISISQANTTISLNAPLTNFGSFAVTASNSNLQIEDNVSVSNSGSFSVGRDFIVNGTFDSRSGTLAVGRDFTVNGNATVYLGNSSITRNCTNNNDSFISGGISVGGILVNNGSGLIRPINGNQCNTISVTGSVTNSGIITGNSVGVTGGRPPLIINKAPGSGNSVTGGAVVDPSLSCDCISEFTAEGTFFVPDGITQITIQMVGGGGKGGRRTTQGATAGGGGGAYSSSTITVTPGEAIKIVVGNGSTTTAPGGDSWASRSELLSDALILAKGGNSANDNQTTGATGGSDGLGIGQIKFAGGNGADRLTSPNNGRGGGGGGAGGPSGDGGNGSGMTGGSGSGIGGAGGTAPNNQTASGVNGFNYGGGGSGSSKNTSNATQYAGGNGANGYVVISYECPPVETCSYVLSFGTSDGYTVIEFACDGVWNAPEGLLEFEVLAIGAGGGGGARIGGGGGKGGIVHTRADVQSRFTDGLLAGSSFNIVVGSGGNGSTSRNQRGMDGSESSFDLGGDYEIRAGSGGGGGSDDNSSGRPNRVGAAGLPSSFNNSTAGFTVQGSVLFGGSGGGGSINRNGGNGSNNGRNGGNGDDESAGGGGGVNSNGQNGNSSDGGNGGEGRRFSAFDIIENRFFSAGGGGGAEDDGGNGGSSNAGGRGGDDNNPGQNASTPGSGGGGAGADNNSGGRGTNGRVFIRYPNFRILPVEFLYFKADYNSFMRSGDLSWATAKEWENDRFEIERSVNDVKSWETIGQVTGAGYSDEPVEYAYQDINLPLTGGNIFYRLKQFDFSGDFSYSDTKAIRLDVMAGATYWRVYPNPTTGDPINLEMLDTGSYQDEKITVRIVSVTGQYDSIEGTSPTQLSAQLSDILRNKKAGIYTLEINWGIKREYHKVILRR